MPKPKITNFSGVSLFYFQLKMNLHLNSDKDYEKYATEDPHFTDKYDKANITYLRPSSVYGLYEIINTLHPQKIFIKLASELQWKDFENGNIIFIGTVKNLYKIDTLLMRTNVRYHISPYTISIVDGNEKIKNTYSLSWQAGRYQNDFGLILKIQSYKNNSILILSGFSEVGIMESIRTALDKNIEQKIRKVSTVTNVDSLKHFEMVLKVEGVELTAFRTSIIYFNKL
ncbi:MAG: hypothetical protein ACOYVE_00005 [Melioribacter sp.]|uniref:hypothetical protein n=1 Tax=Melioribacter sp. TaxID=2052167 RepID=UPI003BD6B196